MIDNKERNIEIEKGLAKAVFNIKPDHDQQHLEFSTRIQAVSDVQFHSPLLHFSEFQFHWDGFLPPPDSEVVANWSYDLSPETKDDVFVFPKYKGSTAGMFITLENLDANKTELVNNRIQNANKICLFGVISLPSFYETITWLKSKNFHGVLEVVDLSQVPLEIISLYKEKGLLPNSFDIKFNRQNILDYDYSSNKNDLILSDVLGYYLDTDKYQKLKEVVSESLNDQGLWITRELVEPQGKPDPNKMTVTLDKQAVKERLTKLGNFIEKYMGNKPTIEELEQFENTRWLHLPTYSRKANSEYFDNLPSNLEVIDSTGATSEALSPENQPPRIFHTSIIQKHN